MIRHPMSSFLYKFQLNNSAVFRQKSSLDAGAKSYHTTVCLCKTSRIKTPHNSSVIFSRAKYSLAEFFFMFIPAAVPSCYSGALRRSSGFASLQLICIVGSWRFITTASYLVALKQNRDTHDRPSGLRC